MIDLTALSTQSASPRLIDFGGFLTPPLGGPVQRVDRMGNRYALDVTLPPMRIEPHGRVWVSRLTRAKTEGAFIRFPQVEFTVGASGAPTVGVAVTGGRTLTLAGAQPGYSFREGQFISILHGGRRYLHNVDASAGVVADGTVVLSVTPMIRAALLVGDAVEVAQPRLEGIIIDEWGWTVDSARTVGISFTLTEAA
jgi:hypothetical protein